VAEKRQNRALEVSPESALRRDYRATLDALSGEIGVPPEQLHEQITRAIDETHISAECLTLVEVDAWMAGQLPLTRHAHVSGCPVCTELMALVAVEHPDSEATFTSRAARAASADVYRRGLLVGVGLGLVATLLAALKNFKST